MQFATERIVKIGADGVVGLREPTNEEWNNFSAELVSFKRHGKVRDESVEARGLLFDRIVTRLDNFIDPSGAPITLETKERFPLRIKSDIIFNTFQQSEIVVDEKN